MSSNLSPQLLSMLTTMAKNGYSPGNVADLIKNDSSLNISEGVSTASIDSLPDVVSKVTNDAQNKVNDLVNKNTKIKTFTDITDELAKAKNEEDKLTLQKKVELFKKLEKLFKKAIKAEIRRRHATLIAMDIAVNKSGRNIQRNIADIKSKQATLESGREQINQRLEELSKELNNSPVLNKIFISLAEKIGTKRAENIKSTIAKIAVTEDVKEKETLKTSLDTQLKEALEISADASEELDLLAKKLQNLTHEFNTSDNFDVSKDINSIVKKNTSHVRENIIEPTKAPLDTRPPPNRNSALSLIYDNTKSKTEPKENSKKNPGTKP